MKIKLQQILGAMFSRSSRAIRMIALRIPYKSNKEVNPETELRLKVPSV
jgi:hypothetical protein